MRNSNGAWFQFKLDIKVSVEVESTNEYTLEVVWDEKPETANSRKFIGHLVLRLKPRRSIWIVHRRLDWKSRRLGMTRNPGQTPKTQQKL